MVSRASREKKNHLPDNDITTFSQSVLTDYLLLRRFSIGLPVRCFESELVFTVKKNRPYLIVKKRVRHFYKIMTNFKDIPSMIIT